MAQALPEEAPLLAVEVDEEVPQSVGRRQRPPMLAGAVVAIVGTTAVIALLAGKANNITAADVSEVEGLSLFGSNNPQSMTCYTYAGETCHIMDECKAKGAVCKSGSCMCEGSCMGADGMCHAGKTNLPVAEDFTLTNVHYSKYSMYFQSMSTFGQMKTTKAYSAMNLEKDKFTLHLLPGVAKKNNGNGNGNNKGTEVKFILASERWPTLLARMGGTGGTALAADAFYATDLSKGKPIESLQVTMCWDAANKAMMLGNGKGTKWAYIRKASWKVYGSNAKRGSHDKTALWKPTPMFTADQIKQFPTC